MKIISFLQRQGIGRLVLPLLMLLLPGGMWAANDSIYIGGRVLESLGKTDLTDAVVMMLDSAGNATDTCRCNRSYRIVNGERVARAFYSFLVPKCDSVYVLEVSCPRYTTQTFNFEVKDLKKREYDRPVPTVYLQRAPRELNELTVTATKVKFYNRGDTIVYNADAFELAEGSMLDALIEQLPGVELKEGGQIYVNGELVESLLLNGREFFDDNNELMLENIGAYTVKDIEVYKGYTTDEKWKKQTYGEKHLTMDVKLKREYNTGLTANAQMGYGTDDRYMARLFGLWYNNSTRLTAIANFNNLNDTRKPGQKDTWSPDMLPSGTRKYQMGAFDYNYINSEETKRFRGDITYTGNINDSRNTTYRTNFLSSGNTYENSFSNNYNRNTRLSSYHYGQWRGKTWMPGYVFKGIYQDRNNESESLSGAFSEDRSDMTLEALKALYTESDESVLRSILNRASTRSDGRSHSTELQFFPSMTYFVPHTDDILSNEFGVRYRWRKEDIWKDYTVNYGANPVPGDRRRQYIDNSPNTLFRIDNNLEYAMRINNVSLALNYEYRFISEVKDSYQYALDRLADEGVFGQLPSGWMNTLDPQNSYTSRMIENAHVVTPRFAYYLFGDKINLIIHLAPDFTFRHSHLDYERAGRLYPIRRNFFLTSFGGWASHFEVNFGKFKTYQDRNEKRHGLSLDLMLAPKTPNLYDLTDIVDDSNPLNIYVGNPDLKVEKTYNFLLVYKLNGSDKRPVMNSLRLSGSLVKDGLTRGYIYDTATGVRTSRMYNVDGSRDFSVSDHFSIEFGRKNQFTLTTNPTFTLSRFVDMIGVDSQSPSKSRVNNRFITENLAFSWQIGRQSLQLRGEYTNRHSSSERENYLTNANHFVYGVIGNFKLPYGIGINTDFNVYSRRGYGVKELDTNDAIWNVRLTWTPPRAKQWTLMLDGFDMLHQLSNVNYAVSASGRVVSYTNALPRYVMLSFQYKLQRKPKRK